MENTTENVIKDTLDCEESQALPKMVVAQLPLWAAKIAYRLVQLRNGESHSLLIVKDETIVRFSIASTPFERVKV